MDYYSRVGSECVCEEYVDLAQPDLEPEVETPLFDTVDAGRSSDLGAWPGPNRGSGSLPLTPLPRLALSPQRTHLRVRPSVNEILKQTLGTVYRALTLIFSSDRSLLPITSVNR